MSPVSNGEWIPPEPTKKARIASQLIAEEVEIQAKRHAMTRGEFLRTAAGTCIAFSVLNRVNGLEAWGANSMLPAKKVHCEDLDAGRELLDKDDFFIVDVQTHHADVENLPAAAICFLRFGDSQACLDDPSLLGQLNYIKEVFVDSETDVAVISGAPGVVQGPQLMAETRDLANELACSERCLSQAIVNPVAQSVLPASPQLDLDQLEFQVNELGAKALKTYTYNGNWRLDDEAVAYPMLEEAQRLKLKLVNTHKGLPAIFSPGSEESVRTLDYPKVLADFPKLKFCAYHSGYFQAGQHPEGKDGITEFVEMAEALPKKHRKRLYAEMGSTFATTLLGPDMEAAHYVGQLLKTLGSKNILWGTDSIWWGSPQFAIDAFKNLQIPESLQEQFGYPELKMRDKKRIFGKNAAKLYKIKKRKKRCTIPADTFAEAQLAQGGPREGRSLKVYGARSRREFLEMFGWGYG
ncbi:MAG: amidohydrolase [Myxococcales bacterium]|nr:amidohydrolase [Myxococcales bacterium]